MFPGQRQAPQPLSQNVGGLLMLVWVWNILVTYHEPSLQRPPAPKNNVKMFKGWPPQDALSGLVQLWYKLFRIDQSGLIEMKVPTRLSNTSSTV